jgi:hypothetical protein
MRSPTRVAVTSAQQADPLSWFTGPYLPLAFTGFLFVFGTVATALMWNVSDNPWLQFAGLWLCVLAGLVVHIRTRPLQRPLGWGTSALALATATLGMLLSALDYRGTDLNLGLWWGPAGPAFVLLSLAPYLPPRKVWVLGLVSAAATVSIGTAVLLTAVPVQGPVTLAIVIAYPPLMALAAATIFSYSIVSTMLPMLESPSRIMAPGQKVRDDAVAEMEHVTLARLTARAAPFLEHVADAGLVTPADRALAGQLARRLRDDLVTQANESWLDSIAESTRLVVVDPDHLAHHMNNAQRTALLAMLQAILDMPETDTGSLMIELRTATDGATAAAISMDMTLPEGRRIMHLAPYYLTLRTAVDDLYFDRDRLTFTISSREQ